MTMWTPISSGRHTSASSKVILSSEHVPRRSRPPSIIGIPACNRLIDPLLYFKGFHALQTQRFSHALWHVGRKDFALYLQSQYSRVFSVDIHPAAKIGREIMFDHGSGIVIGETAEIGDNGSLLHNVTLGGSGKETGDRHPKVGRGVMIGAGAKILGNIVVGDCARIAAGSVVLKDVRREQQLQECLPGW